MSSVMTASSPDQILMAGSSPFETTLPPKLDITVAARSLFFQPPGTPSTSSSLHRSTTLQDDTRSTSRKRFRCSSILRTQPPPLSAKSPLRSCTTTGSSFGFESPAPFVSTDYKLVGGLDTPTTKIASIIDRKTEEYQACSDLYLRGGRELRAMDPTSDSYFPLPSSALARESNGRSRINQIVQAQDLGLGRAMSNVVGIAGKVFEFCKTAAFRGFYAGGGPGYEIKAPTCSPDYDQSEWLDAKKDGLLHNYELKTGSIPGRFPDEDFIPDWMSRDHLTPPRASKKVQRQMRTGEMSASWVMVRSNSTSRETSPSRLSHRKVTLVNTTVRRPMLKLGRRPILPASRPSCTSYAGSSGLPLDQSASFASPRSHVDSSRYGIPANAEVQRHAARIRKREMEEDADLKRFNRQLKAMIKEGKEALGTTFEVLDATSDEVFIEGGYMDGSEKG